VTTTPNDTGLQGSAERFERLMEVVSLASVGEYAAALAHCNPLQEDSFGMLEEGLRVFIGELRDGQREREEAATALARAQEDIDAKLTLIEAQSREIRALSTPILDVWDDVLAVPLVGTLDHARTLEITEKLLQRVVERRARWSLIDLTGVDEVDEATADHLVKLARAVALVGGRCVVTGVSPQAAQIFVSLGHGLGELRCLPNLKEGLRHCLAARRSPLAGRAPG
jgi:rsbT co-antagonist protein RsbR